MSFLPFSNYATILGIAQTGDTTPTTPEARYVRGFLAFLENYIRSRYHLNFGTDVETRQFRGTEEGIHIITTGFLRDIEAITEKKYDDSYSEVFTEFEDYLLDKVSIGPKPSYQLRTLCGELRHPYYLEIRGKFTFSDELPFDIDGAVIELLEEGLSKFKLSKSINEKNGRSVSRVEIGDVKTDFEKAGSGITSTYSKLVNESQLRYILETIYQY